MTSPTSKWSPTGCRVSISGIVRSLAPCQHCFVFVCFWFFLVFHPCVCMFNVFICVPVMSVSIDEGGSHSNSSEDEADNLTTSSPRASSSSSTTPSSPLDMPFPFPSLSPSLCSPCLPSTPSSTGLSALDLESPCSSHDVDSVCGSGHVSPLLGPRSQCSGASSPDCEQERGVFVHHICVGVCVFCHNSIQTVSSYLHIFTTHNSNGSQVYHKVTRGCEPVADKCCCHT